MARRRPGRGRGGIDRLHRRLAGAWGIGAGGVGGRAIHRRGAQRPPALPPGEALNAHRLYVTEVRHPIEVQAGEDHLLPWLSRRVGTNLRAPNLESYSLKLLGGRLLPGINGPAAMFMYETPAGERYTFYCSR